MASGDGGYSFQDPEDSASDYAARQFQIDQTLARVRTMVLVKVLATTDGGGAIAAPGTVNVQPLVQMVDGQGNATNHGTVFNIPVFRVGSSWGAVILDPVEGDIGWMAVADRDISSVKNTKAIAPPGSRRKFDMADGVYMGSLLGATPTQYIVFTENGINIVSGSSGVTINGVTITQSGAIEAPGEVTAKFGTGAFVTLSGHLTASFGTPPEPGH
jgi:hypothetical protein